MVIFDIGDGRVLSVAVTFMTEQTSYLLAFVLVTFKVLVVAIDARAGTTSPMPDHKDFKLTVTSKFSEIQHLKG